MKHDRACTYLRRDEALVASLYDDDSDPIGRSAFQSHLQTCLACRDELEALQGVRGHLARWAPPEPSVGTVVGPMSPAPAVLAKTHAPLDVWRGVPWWAQAAAAVLCVGVGMGAANLRITRGGDGVTVRTGWLPLHTPAPAPVNAPPSTADSTTWRQALDALEQELRQEIRQARGTLPVAGPEAGGKDAIRQMRALVADSERRQQRELALRMGALLADVQAQRVSDLSKIDRSLGVIQSSTGMEVLRQREMLNSLAVRVSQQP